MAEHAARKRVEPRHLGPGPPLRSQPGETPLNWEHQRQASKVGDAHTQSRYGHADVWRRGQSGTEEG